MAAKIYGSLASIVAVAAMIALFLSRSEYEEEPTTEVVRQSAPSSAATDESRAARDSASASQQDSVDHETSLVRASFGALGSVPFVPRRRIQDLAWMHVTTAYPRLEARAENGDGQAAYELFRALSFCGEFEFRTRDKLEAAIERLYQTRTLPSVPAGVPTNMIDDERLGTVETTLRNQFEHCEGVEDDRIAEAEDWLQLAASLGHVESWHYLGGRSNDAASRSFLESAWLAGDIDAAYQLAAAYSEYSDQPADHVRAYAYGYLYRALLEAEYQHHGLLEERPITMRFLERADQWLDAEREQLQPWQIVEAIDMARGLLESNTACCTYSGLTWAFLRGPAVIVDEEPMPQRR